MIGREVETKEFMNQLDQIDFRGGVELANSIATLEDIMLIERIDKEFYSCLKDTEPHEPRWLKYRLMSCCYIMGRIHGIREERAKKKARE